MRRHRLDAPPSARVPGGLGDLGGQPPHPRPGPPPAGGSSWSAVFDDLESADESIIGSLPMTPGVGMVPEPLDPTQPRGAFVGGLLDAGPLAVAGLAANGANVVATVVVAHSLTTRAYGSVAQLLGLFFILSMPGSAVLVAVVRRLAADGVMGRGPSSPIWVTRLYRRAVVGVVAFAVLAVAVQGALARQLSLPDDHGVAAMLAAGGVWLLVSIDRGVLQAGRRYRPLAANLLVEGTVRTSLVVVLTVAGLGVWGYALGFVVAELAAAVHARYHARRAMTAPRAGERAVDVAPARARPAIAPDVATALVGFALLGILQNADVVLVGRLHPANAGAYAAISVAAKSLVFGAILLGSYVLPEATIRWRQGHHALRQLGVTLLFLLAPALVLLAMAVVVPRPFLTTFFSSRLADAAPAFAPLVGAMTCLGVTVIVTNYLLGAARRWIVGLLALGAGLAVSLIDHAGGRLVSTADADLVVQAGLLAATSVAFVGVHLRRRRPQRVPAEVGPVR